MSGDVVVEVASGALVETIVVEGADDAVVVVGLLLVHRRSRAHADAQEKCVAKDAAEVCTHGNRLQGIPGRE
jgi:hypothetical protein